MTDQLLEEEKVLVPEDDDVDPADIKPDGLGEDEEDEDKDGDEDDDEEDEEDDKNDDGEGEAQL